MKKIANILFAEISPALIGLQTIFDIEKISYNLCNRSDKPPKALVDIFVGDTEAALERGKPAVFIGRANRFITEHFKIEGSRGKEAKFVDIEIKDGFLSGQAQKVLAGYLPDMRLRLPAKGLLLINENHAGSGSYKVMAYFTGSGTPAIIKKDNIIWCLFDIGEVFYLLISEGYINRSGPKKGGGLISFLPILQKLYYRAPDYIRKVVTRRLFAKLLARVDSEKAANFRTEFPVDCAGFVVIQMLRAMLLHTGIPLVSIKKFPAGYNACTVFTHDIEPTVFAYKKGIVGLLDELKKHKINSSIGLVAAWAKNFPGFIKYSSKNSNLEFHCQGLYHTGMICGFSFEELRDRLSKAKSILEGLLSREIPVYRSPRLNRSEALIRAIEAAGYKYSSISVDVDRENMHSFGGGVSLNFPFRPIITYGRQARKARFLEFPVTAPDCIVPVFTGLSEEELRRAYLEKINFIRNTGGFFISLIHAGVFNHADCRLRHRLLNFVINAVEGDSAVWKPGFHKAYQWWILRENLCAGIDNGKIFIENNNRKAVSGVSIEIATLAGSNELKLDNLPEAGRVSIRLEEQEERAPKWSYL